MSNQPEYIDHGEYVKEAEHLVDEAQKKGIFLRILGSTGFRIHSPEFVAIHTAMARPMTDVDFMAYGKQIVGIEKFFQEAGYEQMRAALTPELFASRRIFNHKSGLHVDVFLDNLSMCHVVPFAGRLEKDSPTIPLAELAMEKLQIVQLAEKDVKDMLILLAAHPIGDNDHETINGKYIGEVFGKDWGFYYTATINLGKIRNGIQRYQDLFQPEHIQHIQEHLTALEKMIEEAPKSLKWKARAAIGPKVKWYNDVDDVERAEHLSDLA